MPCRMYSIVHLSKIIRLSAFKSPLFYPSSQVNSILFVCAQAQRADPAVGWSVGEDFLVGGADVTGEVVVAGVYIRLFITNPGQKVQLFTLMRIRIQLFTQMQIRIQLLTVMRIRIRIQLLFIVIGICDHWSIDPRLCCEPPKLINFDFMRIRIWIQFFTLMRIRIQLPKIMWIPLGSGNRNPGWDLTSLPKKYNFLSCKFFKFLVIKFRDPDLH